MREKLLTLSAVVLLAGTPLFARGVDSDNDGVRDRKDTCPSTPISVKIDKGGCPVDGDADGVYDGIDKCARTPASFPVDEIGCSRDTDKDAVVDGLDGCAGTPLGAKVDSKGCPWDSDGDAVLEGLDRCAGTPPGHRVDGFGCPMDGDHDGVNDALDQCARSKPLEIVDAGGCRVKAPELFSPGSETVRLQGVTFEKNKIEIPEESAPVLMDVAASLTDWPDTRVEIGVHTDRAGSASANRELSRRRALYLASFIEALGVEPSRLQAKGYGESARLAERCVDLKKVE